METVSEGLKLHEAHPDEARAVIVRAAEINAINCGDIVPVFRAFRHLCHEEFVEPTRWSLLNAFTEHAKKYSPGRADVCRRGLTRLFGTDGKRSALWGDHGIREHPLKYGEALFCPTAGTPLCFGSPS